MRLPHKPDGTFLGDKISALLPWSCIGGKGGGDGASTAHPEAAVRGLEAAIEVLEARAEGEKPRPQEGAGGSREEDSPLVARRHEAVLKEPSDEGDPCEEKCVKLMAVLAVLQDMANSASAAQGGGKCGASQSVRGAAGSDHFVQEAVEALEELVAADLPVRLVALLPFMRPEARNAACNLFCSLLWEDMPPEVVRSMHEYLRHHKRFQQLLIEGYKDEETALHCGIILRSCLRHLELADAFFQGSFFLDLLRYAKHDSITIACDVFSSLRQVLMASHEHKTRASRWISEHFRAFFGEYALLLAPGEEFFWVRTQALLLLSSILFERDYQKVMLAYVDDVQQLRLCMNLLREPSAATRIQAFHIFKFFAANPRKTSAVRQILFRNRERLVQLLEAFLEHSSNDEEVLRKDLTSTIARLQTLPAEPGGNPPASSSAVGACSTGERGGGVSLRKPSAGAAAAAQSGSACRAIGDYLRQPTLLSV
jgi:calcium binding protein 39